MNKTYIVTPSIGLLDNLGRFSESFLKNKCRILVVDEGDTKMREANERLLSDIPHAFYGPRERESWFKGRFGSKFREKLSIIPERCHAEISFGFLAAFEEEADIIIELDDDVFPDGNGDTIAEHQLNLDASEGIAVSSACAWYNTMDNLSLNVAEPVFPRGHPYHPETRLCEYFREQAKVSCALNMGLWSGHPDLDAVTILHYGGLDGRCSVQSMGVKRSKIILAVGTYAAICSMNTSFRADIVPAFYQLSMNLNGLDRFDDIWSGMFLKKICDHLGGHISLGRPIVEHRKTGRSVFRDLSKELEGLAINEQLWRIVDEVQIEGSGYTESYMSLIDELSKRLNRFRDNRQRKLVQHQVDKMKLWLDVVDGIS